MWRFTVRDGHRTEVQNRLPGQAWIQSSRGSAPAKSGRSWRSSLTGSRAPFATSPICSHCFAKHNVALVLVTESIDTSTAIGRLLANLIGSVAQWEREAVGERTAFALAHKRRNRLAYSPTPFGYRRDGTTLIPDDCQQQGLAKARQLDADGSTLKQIGAAPALISIFGALSLAEQDGGRSELGLSGRSRRRVARF